jgi:hypothetical protein
VGRVVNQASGGSQRPWISRDYYDQVFLSPTVELSQTGGGGPAQENRPPAAESAKSPPAEGVSRINLLELMGIDTHPSRFSKSLDEKITNQNLPQIIALAEKGHTGAQWLLGRIYHKGKLVPKTSLRP